jgi:hypothetical protein
LQTHALQCGRCALTMLETQGVHVRAPMCRLGCMTVTAPQRSADSLPAKPPLSGSSQLRAALTLGLWLLVLATLSGGVLLLMLWQQDRSVGVLTVQVQRVWDLLQVVRRAETVIAAATVLVAMAWIVLATLNVCRVSARRRYPVVVALTLPAALANVWIIGDMIVAESESVRGEIAGMALQALVLAVPLVSLEYVANAVGARRNPFRASYVLGVALVVHLQVLAGLSTVDDLSDPERWGLLAAHLILGALLQVLFALAVIEGCRSFDEAADHRYSARRSFAETVLTDAAR